MLVIVKMRSSLSHMTLQCIFSLPLPFLSNLARSLPFSNTLCFFPILREAEFCKYRAVFQYSLYNKVTKICMWTCSDNRANVSPSVHLPKNAELFSWLVQGPGDSSYLEDPSSFKICMIPSKNFNSVAVAKAHKKCS